MQSTLDQPAPHPRSARGQPAVQPAPAPATAADHRRMAAQRDRRQDAQAALVVLLVSLLVFWLLPGPATARPLASPTHHSPGDLHGPR
jgi:hypothetical protein